MYGYVSDDLVSCDTCQAVVAKRGTDVHDEWCAKVQQAIGWQEWLVEKNRRALEAASDPAWWRQR